MKINCSLRYSYAVIFVLSTFLFLNSCKKNESPTPADELNNAKSWFNSQLKSSSSYIKSDHGDSAHLSIVPNWNKVTQISLEDQAIAFAVPVTTNLYSVIKRKGNLVLLVRKINNAYSSRLVNIISSGQNSVKQDGTLDINYNKIYKDAFSKVEEFKSGLRTLSIAPSNNVTSGSSVKSSGKISDIGISNKEMAITARCIEWIKYTDYYVDGIWVGQTQETLGITCIGGDEGVVPDYGGGGGGGGGIPETVDLGSLPDLDISELGDFPEFKKLITDLPNFLKKYPNIVKALSLTTGFTEAKIMQLMQPGKGPKVVVVDNLVDKYGNGISGHFDNANKVLLINGAYVRGLDIVNNPIRYSAIGLMLTVTTLHEFVHFGRDSNTLSVGFPGSKGNTYEAGWYFEDSIQPGDVGRLGPETAIDWLNYYKIKPKN